VKLTRDPANGNIIKGNVINDARTDPLIQTDFNLRHDIMVKEGQRLSFEATFLNLLNQRASTADYEFMIPTNEVYPNRVSRFSGDPGVDWGKVMLGYNYIDALNATGAFGGNLPGTSTPIQAKLTLASRYGLPQLFQQARNLRLAIRFTF
jgi:hypothetical protein